MADSQKSKTATILGGVAAVIAAVTGLIVALNPNSSQKPQDSNPVVQQPTPTQTPAQLPEGSRYQTITGNNNMQVSGSNNVISSGIDDNSIAKLDTLSTTTSAIDNKTDVLVARSERQPQIAMAEFVSFRGKKKSWLAPNKIFPGSIVELHGFSCVLRVITDAGFNAEVSGMGWSEASEVVIVGRSGVPSKWRISTDSTCEGKVIVFSSPRIRSLQRSWSEEKVPN